MKNITVRLLDEERKFVTKNGGGKFSAGLRKMIAPVRLYRESRDNGPVVGVEINETLVVGTRTQKFTQTSAVNALIIVSDLLKK